MKMNIPASKETRLKMAVPYKNGDLMTLDSFIRYCGKNGLRINRDQLEYFDRTGLVIPALYLKHEVAGPYYEVKNKSGKNLVYTNDISKADKDAGNVVSKPFYKKNGVSLVDGDIIKTINSSAKQELRTNPAKVNFTAWKSFKPQKKGWVNDPKEIKKITVCYSKFQLYVLKLIKSKRAIEVSGAQLVKGKKGWSEISKAYKKFISVYSDDFLMTHICNFYKLCDFLNAAVIVLQKANIGVSRHLEDAIKDRTIDGKLSPDQHCEAINDAKSYFRNIKPKIRFRLKELMNQYDISVEDIESFQRELVSYSCLSTAQLSPYLINQIAEATLTTSEASLYHAYLMNLVLMHLKERQPGFKRFLLKSDRNICQYCFQKELLTRANAKTCGDKKCKQAHENEWKKQNYRLNSKQK